MQSLTIPLSILDRIVAVHIAAADRERTSPVLMGVSIAPYLSPDNAHGITIAATDGKVLVEESYVLAGVSSSALASPLIISEMGSGILADWLKSIRKAMPHAKNRDLETMVSVDEKSVTVSILHSPVGATILGIVDGTFPPYAGALDLKCQADESGNLLRQARVGINADYMGRLEKLWGVKGKAITGIMMDFRSRGILVSPVNTNYSGVRRGLIMPIILSD
jgi:hypothetical protein